MDRVTTYAKNVVSRKVTAGNLHILACKRHLEDLEKQQTDNFPYYWDTNQSEKVLRYAETLTIAEGSEERPVKLIGSQVFDIGCTFGWRKVKNDKRRFRRRYKSMARQNGKTFENGIIGTYIGGFSGYNYGKLFTVAPKKRQSRLAWDEMAKFINTDKDLKKLFSVKEYKSLIYCEHNNCTIEALSRESGLDDGFRAIFASIDEIHQHRDNRIYKAIYNGTKALDETLVSMITTRGDILNSFCKEMDDFCIGVLTGLYQADDMFIDIYALDAEDDIFDSKNWIKSNPFIASTENGIEVLKTDAATARDMGGMELRDFVIKSLNMWSENTDAHFIDTEKWKKCASNRKLENFKGQHCTIGIDLSSGGDLTSIALEFETTKQDKTCYYLYSHSFMPRGRLHEHIVTDLAPYDIWNTNGLITVTGGDMDFKNDYGFIINHLKELIDVYSLKVDAIGIDPHNADGVLGQLEALGCPIIVVTQSARNLNDATIDMQLNVKSETVEYDEENELLTWSFNNARLVQNSFGEKKIDKKVGMNTKRIDPVDASINARYVRMTLLKNQPVNVAEGLNEYLKHMKRR